MKKWQQGCAAIGLVCMLSGCVSTVMTFSDATPENKVFIGARSDAAFLSAAAAGHRGDFLNLNGLWPLIALDLPLSMATDVVYLPYTVTDAALR